MTDDSNYAEDDYDDGMMLLKTPAVTPTNIENKMFAGKIPNPLLVSNPDPVERQCMMQTNMREREEDGYNQDICVGVASTCLRTAGSTTSSPPPGTRSPRTSSSLWMSWATSSKVQKIMFKDTDAGSQLWQYVKQYFILCMVLASSSNSSNSIKSLW